MGGLSRGLRRAWMPAFWLAAMSLAEVAAQAAPPAFADTWRREPVLNNRRDHAMVYHAASREVLLFGGTDRNESFGDTWVFDGRRWAQVATPHAPGARHGHVMAYDSRRRRVLLFGGEGGWTDLWAYDGRDWTRIETPHAPPPLKGPAMAFDDVHGAAVLFGGRQAGVGYGRSTWIFDGTDWAEIPASALPVAPPGRRGHTLVQAPSLGLALLFGGYRYVNRTSAWLNDLWAWDGRRWTPIAPGDPRAVPPPRYLHGAAFDAARGRLVIFGGSRNHENVVLLSDTWLYALHDAAWFTAGAAAPTARVDHAMSFDVKRREVVLFGGDDGEAPYRAFRDDTWIWNNASWEPVPAGIRPSGRRDHRMVYDIGRGVHLLFGGDDGRQRLDDTWVFDGTRWKARSPARRPPARSRHAMAYQAFRGRTLLFGGFDGRRKLDDTWEWDGATWIRRATPVAPPRRSRHAMACDLLRRRVVLFGGEGEGGVKRNDTWEWDGERWIRKTPRDVPPGRDGHAMAYDLLRGEVVLFGGQGASGRLDDTWAWDGQNWQPLHPTAAPPVRTRHALVYNAGRQRLMAFGGLGRRKPVSDTWSFLPVRFRATPPEVRPGQTLTFEMKLPDQKGRYYLVALAFDRAPGVPLSTISVGQVELPLKPDWLTLTGMNLTGFWGSLDRDGRASASVKILPDRRLVGMRFFACGVAFDDRNHIGAVTNEVAVVIVL